MLSTLDSLVSFILGVFKNLFFFSTNHKDILLIIIIFFLFFIFKNKKYIINIISIFCKNILIMLINFKNLLKRFIKEQKEKKERKIKIKSFYSFNLFGIFLYYPHQESKKSIFVRFSAIISVVALLFLGFFFFHLDIFFSDDDLSFYLPLISIIFIFIIVFSFVHTYYSILHITEIKFSCYKDFFKKIFKK